MKPFVPPKVDHLTFEEAVRICAHAGMSRTHTAEHLGLTHFAFLPMLDELGPIEWAETSNTVRNIERMQARRGMSTPAIAAATHHARTIQASRRHRTLRGVTGSLEQLIAHFKPEVSERTIRERLAKGIDIERAFFDKPYQRHKPKGVKQKRQQYNYRGFTGTLREIFGRHTSAVAYETFRFRVTRRGWAIGEALRAPSRRAKA